MNTINLQVSHNICYTINTFNIFPQKILIELTIKWPDLIKTTGTISGNTPGLLVNFTNIDI
jgi:hypothetical protein